MLNRLEINKQILKNLEYYIEKYPDMRFCQLLYFLNIIDNTDKFYEESNTTLVNMNWKSNLNNGFTK